MQKTANRIFYAIPEERSDSCGRQRSKLSLQLYVHNLKEEDAWKYTAKVQKIMRIASCFLICASMCITSIAASQKVSFSGKNISIKKLISTVQAQTGYSFVYNKSLLLNSKPISMEAKDMELAEFLEVAFKSQDINIRIDNGTIVLSRKPDFPATPQSGTWGRTDTVKKITITGSINLDDALTGLQPLQGATITEKGTKNATVSNEKGQFSLSVHANARIVISHVTIDPIEEPISANRSNYVITAKLKEDKETEEVVVTGYYTRKKETFTGASTTITRKELEKFNNNNILSVIQSLDPAFNMQENINAGSDPNQLPDINIRGISSVGSNVNLPLIIIDGFQGTLQQLYDMDMNRIESISILKDASATILYGSRAGNGVLVIETRLPKAGKFTVSYDFRPSLTLVDLSDYNLMNAKEKLEVERLANVYKYDGADTDDPAWTNDYQMKLDNLYRDRELAVQSGVNTYWLSQPVQSTVSTSHSLRAEGGNDEVRYSIDGSYSDFRGAMKQSGRTRYGAGFNLIYRIPNKITVRNNASYQGIKERNSPYGSFSLYTELNPYERIEDENGKLITIYNDLGQFGSTLLGGRKLYNPLYNAQLPYKDFRNSSILTNNLSLDWFINDRFRFNAVAIIMKSFEDGELYRSPLHTSYFEVTDVAKRGSYTITNGNAMQYQGNMSLQYGQNINNHSITASAIGELRAANTYQTSYSMTGFVDDRFISPSLALSFLENSRPGYSALPERLMGVAANIHYNYNQKYLTDFSYRLDGSSKFGREDRIGSFWSAGLGYNLHKEAFFDNSKISLFRIFANLGETGNENFTADMTSTAYRFSNSARYYNKNAAAYASQGNAGLTWPKVFQKSAGVEMTFWDKKANVKFNIYERVTNRMISNITVAPSMGFADNKLYENLGEVSNKGFELSANLMVYSNDQQELYWNINFSAVQNKSKLRKISDELRRLNETLVQTDKNGNVIQTSNYYEENQSLTIFRGVPSLGIDPASGREIYLTKSGERSFNWSASDQIVIGDGEPDLRGTFGTDLTFKSFSFRAIFLYNVGADVYNRTLVSKVENASPYVNGDRRILQDRWIQDGDVKAFKGISDQTITQVTSRFVQQENTVRLTSLNINYDFKKAFISRYNLQRLRLNFSTNDMFRLSTVKMERGIDYPFARTYNMGIMLEF